MKVTSRMIVWLTTVAMVLALAVPVAAAKGPGSGQGGGEKPEAKHGDKVEEPEVEEPEVEEQEVEEQEVEEPEVEEPEVEEPEDGAETPEAGVSACSETQSTPGTTTGTTTDTTTGTSTEPCVSNAGKANVSLTGRGKAAEHNPNVDATGQLIPGSAADKHQEDSAAEEQQEKEHIKRVKNDSRAKALEERSNGEKGAYLVYVDGKRLNLTPLAKGGRTLVPFRRLAETLGAEVSWDPSTRTVTMVKGENTVVLTIGTTTATVNGKEVTLQVASEIVEGSTFVPLRFIAEALGADVDFDQTTGAITVISPTTGADTGTTTGTTTGTDTGTTTGTTTGTDTGTSTGTGTGTTTGTTTGTDTGTTTGTTTGTDTGTSTGTSTGTTTGTGTGTSTGSGN